MPRITFDTREVLVEPGATILEAAQQAGLYVPTLCHHPALDPVREMRGAALVFRGDRRVESEDQEATWDGCGLCAVEVGGALVRACATPVEEGMVVSLDSEKVVAERRARLYEILLHHPHACLSCAQAEGCSRTQCSSNVPVEERCCELLGSCELQRVAQWVGLPSDLPRYRPQGIAPCDTEPLFRTDMELCIGCLRCVRACQGLVDVGAIAFVLEGGRRTVGTAAGFTRMESECRFCGACVEVCPTGALLDKVRASGEGAVEALVPCRTACPAEIDIPRLLRHVAAGEPERAAAVIREKVPLAFAAGTVCFHPCEDVCRRAEISEPLSVCRLKRWALETSGEAPAPERRPPTGKRVAVVGSGPAGLTTAYFLSLKGHDVTVHERLPEPGGMLSVGVPEYRYPKDLLDRDIAAIRASGVTILCGSEIDQAAFEKLVRECDAVFLAPGAHGAKRIPLPGSHLENVYWGVEFLRHRALGSYPEDLFAGKRVVVVGGGNVAVDAARVARRLGAGEVRAVSLESDEERPAWKWEIEEAREEGVSFEGRWGPKEVLGGGGRVTGVTFKRCTRVFDERRRFDPAYDEKETVTFEADAVILAIGQEVSSEPFRASGVQPGGTLRHDPETLATSVPKVYAGGDAATGPKSFIEAVAAGRRAASAIDKSLGGDGDIEAHAVPEPPAFSRGRVEGFASRGRFLPPITTGPERAASFCPIEACFSPEQARLEALRCLRCDFRFSIPAAAMAPRKESLSPLCAESVERVPEEEGVFHLFDGQKNVTAIKGVMNLRKGLEEVLGQDGGALFFTYEKEPMYTKRESELLQSYLQEHGRLPGGGADELDDLY